MRIYLAGPMTGYVNSNHDAFEKAALKLRAQGHEVVSPHEHEIPADTRDKWCNALTYDVGECVCKTEGIAVLEGYQHSKGACLEIHTALALNHPVIRIPGQPALWDLEVMAFFRESLQAMWREVAHGVYTHEQHTALL